jgi:rRNA maturation endonuclease Nob1
MKGSITKLKKHITNRFTKEWYWFKVCEGCESIVDIDDALCPICNAYRFDSSEERIKERAPEVCASLMSFIENHLE